MSKPCGSLPSTTYDASLVEYNSTEFHAGFSDGKEGRPCSVSPDFNDVQKASYIEAWLMGDCER